MNFRQQYKSWSFFLTLSTFTLWFNVVSVCNCSLMHFTNHKEASEAMITLSFKIIMFLFQFLAIKNVNELVPFENSLKIPFCVISEIGKWFVWAELNVLKLSSSIFETEAFVYFTEMRQFQKSFIFKASFPFLEEGTNKSRFFL